MTSIGPPEPGCASPGPLLIVLSGPSGVGKDAILSRLRESEPTFHFTTTATTRSIRPGERDGVDYFFLTKDVFQKMMADNELLEWAKVHGNYYGVPKYQIIQALGEGKNVIIKPDVQGAATIKKVANETVLIFIAPPDFNELKRRLTERKTESPEELALRLEIAEQELAEASRFDYVIVNHRDRLDEAVEEIQSIIAKERHRTPPRQISL